MVWGGVEAISVGRECPCGGGSFAGVCFGALFDGSAACNGAAGGHCRCLRAISHGGSGGNGRGVRLQDADGRIGSRRQKRRPRR